MSDIVIAVPKRPLAVLPSFTPENRRQSDEERVLGEEFGKKSSWNFCSDLQTVLFRGVMRHKTRIGNRFDRRRNNVGLSGVQIPATGINSKRPGGEPGGFPSGEGEGVVEELRKGGFRKRSRRREGEEEGVIERSSGSCINGGWGLIRCGEVEEREERSGEVAAKGVGLVGPVQAVGASGVLGEGVLGLVVVLEDLREAFMAVGFCGSGR